MKCYSKKTNSNIYRYKNHVSELSDSCSYGGGSDTEPTLRIEIRIDDRTLIFRMNEKECENLKSKIESFLNSEYASGGKSEKQKKT